MLQAASPLAEETWMVLRIFFEFLFEFRFTNASWSVPNVEGERMVMDLEDVCATFEDQVTQSNILVFGTSLQVPTDGPQDNEEDTIPVTISRITATLEMTLMTVTFKTDRKRKISLQMGFGEILVIPIIPQSFEVFPPQARKNA